jgi:glycosyltransferase involved in cell wall biosynthesis
MKEKDKTLYIANAWTSLVTETAFKNLENQGWKIDGNWLNRKDISPLHRVILAAPAYFDGAVIVYPKDFPSSKIFAHLLYPDELVGWDFQTQKYRMEKQEAFIPLLKDSQILSSSKFTLDLALSTYGDLINQNQRITYLPIEFEKIRAVKAEVSPSGKKSVTRVLWNHMWRSDKGILEALNIIDQLSSRYPEVEFWIGREESWGGNPDADFIKQQAQTTLLRLKSKENVFFQPSFKSSRVIEYWKFLAQFDISFSVSPQEGFGLSMLEQAAAGIACVLPPREAYPEIHRQGLITENVAEGVSELIENPARRKEISQKGIENASSFDAESWSRRIIELIS